MSSKKKTLLRNIFTANVDCGGCGCGKSNLSDIFQPKPKPKAIPMPMPMPKSETSINQKPSVSLYPSSSSSNWERADTGQSLDDEDHTSTTFSLNIESTSPHCSDHQTVHQNHSNMTTKISDSVAVVKESDDPYHDFRRSMVQMILEKEIYSKDDLQELLNCFLQLNSHCHHEIIVRAFMDICNGFRSTI